MFITNLHPRKVIDIMLEEAVEWKEVYRALYIYFLYIYYTHTISCKLFIWNQWYRNIVVN